MTNFSLQSGIQSRTIIYLNVSCLNSTQNQVLKWLYNFRCRLRPTLRTNLNEYLVILKRTKLTFLFLLLYSGQQYHSFFPYVRRLESNSNEKDLRPQLQIHENKKKAFQSNVNRSLSSQSCVCVGALGSMFHVWLGPS